MTKKEPEFLPRLPLCPSCGKLLATVMHSNVPRSMNSWWCEDCHVEFNSRLGPTPKWVGIQIVNP